ncbi:30S ribosomal protein S6--L-glutamate ligase [uncultured Croceitalea sp.]|uniref:30S ribosomal protein S6--L-glutamate ligase n=1 Tax=uncultured Croceitalea sp. TaxID=1798908 RepID=UPI0033060D5F
MKNFEEALVGSEEWCKFDELGIPAIKARVDSGAKTSSIQANKIKIFNKDLEDWVRFEVNPIQDNRSITLLCQAKLVDMRSVKSSQGISEERPVIKTMVSLGTETFEVELTLANRDTMEYRMLLGREALNGRYLVNPSKSFIQGQLSDAEIKEKYRPFKTEKTGLTIGLLASNPQLYSNKRIMEAGEARGHEMVFLNVENAYMKLDAVSPEIRYRGGNILDKFDAVIPRIKPSVTFYGCALLRQFDNLGVYCLNSAEAITKSRDKLFASQLFAKNDIHIPITGFAKSPMDTKDLIRMVNGAPLIIKLLESTQGKGVVLAETNKAAESVINAFKSVQTNILVQEFIKEANGQDIRCFVVNGKVVASMQRQAQKGEFRANIHQGGKASLIKITSEEHKLAIKSAKAMNLVVAGVDIIRSNRGPLLLEVNSSPGLEGIENATGMDIANVMIEAIEKKLKYRTQQQSSVV